MKRSALLIIATAAMAASCRTPSVRTSGLNSAFGGPFGGCIESAKCEGQTCAARRQFLARQQGGTLGLAAGISLTASLENPTTPPVERVASRLGVSANSSNGALSGNQESAWRAAKDAIMNTPRQELEAQHRSNMEELSNSLRQIDEITTGNQRASEARGLTEYAKTYIDAYANTGLTNQALEVAPKALEIIGTGLSANPGLITEVNALNETVNKLQRAFGSNPSDPVTAKFIQDVSMARAKVVIDALSGGHRNLAAQMHQAQTGTIGLEAQSEFLRSEAALRAAIATMRETRIGQSTPQTERMRAVIRDVSSLSQMQASRILLQSAESVIANRIPKIATMPTSLATSQVQPVVNEIMQKLNINNSTRLSNIKRRLQSELVRRAR